MNKPQLGDYLFNRTKLHLDNDTSKFLALVLLESANNWVGKEIVAIVNSNSKFRRDNCTRVKDFSP